MFIKWRDLNVRGWDKSLTLNIKSEQNEYSECQKNRFVRFFV